MKICFSGGSGHSGSVIAALSRLPGAEPAGYCKTYEEERMNAIRPLNLPEYPSLETMLEEVQPDILVSDGMFCRHTPDALVALRRGIPVFCEKPVSVSLDQFESLREALYPEAPLFWAMQTSRYMDSFYTARLLVQEGAIGKIRIDVYKRQLHRKFQRKFLPNKQRRVFPHRLFHDGKKRLASNQKILRRALQPQIGKYLSLIHI